jgi:hypothetical protein
VKAMRREMSKKKLAFQRGEWDKARRVDGYAKNGKNSANAFFHVPHTNIRQLMKTSSGLLSQRILLAAKSRLEG